MSEMAAERDLWVRFAAAALIGALAWFAVASFGAKSGLIPWRFAFETMALRFGPIVLLTAGAFVIVAIALALVFTPRRVWLAALFALSLPIPAIGALKLIGMASSTAPPIHDVSTDLDDPPTFSDEVKAKRALLDEANTLDLARARAPTDISGKYAGWLVSDIQRDAYGYLKPLMSDVPPADMFEIAIAAASDQRSWRVGWSSPEAGVFEAESEEPFFGFVDDIVVRVRPLHDGSGSVVDMRASSRLGLSDRGANARRIRAYFGDLKLKAAASATGG